jgi:hypothetical protein
MKKILLLLFFPFVSSAHPGIGIVADSKGNIYYTDLRHVWKIVNGKRTIAVRGVHTHELYLDRNDNLYGEHVSGGSDYSSTWFHYQWMLSPEGKLDTVFNEKQAYITIDYSLARDLDGNEYYTKQFIRERDTVHIYKKTVDGKESVIARGNFKGVAWLHPQKDGSLLFVQHNTIFRLLKDGDLRKLAIGIAEGSGVGEFFRNSKTIWGVWEDNNGNIYAAVFGDQVVRKIDGQGRRTVVHRSAANWSPLHGVFDKNGKLWVMESSDKNEIRVVEVGLPALQNSKRISILPFLISAAVLLILLFVFLKKRPGSDAPKILLNIQFF